MSDSDSDSDSGSRQRSRSDGSSNAEWHWDAAALWMHHSYCPCVCVCVSAPLSTRPHGRSSLFTHKRQLILTDLPRFVYVDPDKMEYKKVEPEGGGAMQWTGTLAEDARPVAPAAWLRRVHWLTVAPPRFAAHRCVPVLRAPRTGHSVGLDPLRDSRRHDIHHPNGAAICDQRCNARCRCAQPRRCRRRRRPIRPCRPLVRVHGQVLGIGLTPRVLCFVFVFVFVSSAGAVYSPTAPT